MDTSSPGWPCSKGVQSHGPVGWVSGSGVSFLGTVSSDTVSLTVLTVVEGFSELLAGGSAVNSGSGRDSGHAESSKGRVMACAMARRVRCMVTCVS